MTDSSRPTAVDRTYELWLWLDARVADFPVHARGSLGRRITDTAIDAMEAYTDATFSAAESPRLAESLDRANRKLALLRLLLRGSRERRYLSEAQHEHAIERCAELGRMTGGWLRYLHGRASKS